MECENEINFCLDKIRKDLFTGEYFRFKRNDSRKFIRHQAHMVEALAYVNMQKN